MVPLNQFGLCSISARIVLSGNNTGDGLVEYKELIAAALSV
jgi:hypothetical protein